MSSSEWEFFTFSDFVIINPSVKLDSSKEYSFVEMKDLNENYRYVSPSITRKLTGGARFQEKDTLFARITPCLENGKICQVTNLQNGVGFGSTEFLVFRGKAGISDSDFVYYLSRSAEVRKFAELNMLGTSGRQRVTWEAFVNLQLTLPPLPTQHSIVEILSALDDKIELNRQTNNTLEAIAQAIFKEWFVDFNYPGATGEMVDSELGPIPKEWRVGKLNEMLSVQIGGDWGQESPFADAIQAISLRGTDIDSLKSTGNAPKAPIRWIKKSSLEKRSLANTDVLIGASGLGPIGKSIYCDEHIHELFDFPITYSNFCKRLTARSPSKAVYGEIILENLYKSGEMRQFFAGTSIPNLDITSLLDHKIIIPSKDILEEYYELISKCKFHHLFNNESKLLSQVRDSLLPNLLNGVVHLFTLEERCLGML